MSSVKVCPHCAKRIRLSLDIGLTVYRGGSFGENFLCRFVHILPELDGVIVLYSMLYHVSLREKTLEWERAGARDDLEEEASIESFKESLRSVAGRSALRESREQKVGFP